MQVAGDVFRISKESRTGEAVASSFILAPLENAWGFGQADASQMGQLLAVCMTCMSIMLGFPSMMGMLIFEC